HDRMTLAGRQHRLFAFDLVRFGRSGVAIFLLVGHENLPERRLCLMEKNLLCGTSRLVAYFSPCRWASTNQSFLSMSREAPVKRSAVSASPSSVARSMAARTDLPTAANAVDSAST